MKILATVSAGAVIAAAALGTASAQASSPMRYCGMSSNGLGVMANKVTTCPFAKATAKAAFAQPTVSYSWGEGPRAATVHVRSVATHRTIAMKCRMITTPDSPYQLCTGGNGARVEVTS